MTTSPELFLFWGKCWVLPLGVQSFRLFPDCALHMWRKGCAPRAGALWTISTQC